MLYMDFVLRVALSMVLGFLIGLERQLTGHPAGIRINVLICMGTSFFTLFPMLYGSDQVFRVGSSIISGVGFLCSGVIFKDSGSVRGMNTAATLWCTAAIGILASTGMYAMAVTAAVLLIGSNLILRPLARKVNPIAVGEENEKQYRISVTCQESAEQELRALLIHSNACKTLLRELRIRQSMDGESRWADNVMIERWFRSLKTEEIYLNEYPNPSRSRQPCSAGQLRCALR